MSDFDNVKVFGNTSLSDLFKQIHKNNKEVDKQINGLVEVLKPFASSNAGSAVSLMPVVKDLIDVNVRNNDQLIKMAAIAQRAMNTKNDDGESLINYDEVQQLISNSNEIQESSQKLLDKTVQQLKDK